MTDEAESLIAELPAPWEATGTDLSDELEREVPAGHPLHGLPTKALATGGHPDDVLFRIEDGSGRYATVHLTWDAEIDPEWPAAELYPDRSALLSALRDEALAEPSPAKPPGLRGTKVRLCPLTEGFVYASLFLPVALLVAIGLPDLFFNTRKLQAIATQPWLLGAPVLMAAPLVVFVWALKRRRRSWRRAAASSLAGLAVVAATGTLLGRMFPGAEDTIVPFCFAILIAGIATALGLFMLPERRR